VVYPYIKLSFGRNVCGTYYLFTVTFYSYFRLFYIYIYIPLSCSEALCPQAREQVRLSFPEEEGLFLGSDGMWTRQARLTVPGDRTVHVIKTPDCA
jgi:hypothetical protein